MDGDQRRSLPTIDVSPKDSDVEIVPMPNPPPVARNTDGPSMAAFPLTRPTGERKLGSRPPSDPGYADAELDPEESPAAQRPRLRSILSKLLFFTIFSVALTLLACEISIAYKVPWLDPRPRLVKLERFAVEKILKLRGH